MRRRTPLGVALVVALLVLGCGRKSGTGESEIPNSLTLTPQTIVVRDGARALRRISSDGATVTLDGSAAGAGDIKPGSVVLIRDVEVIKAAAVRRDGDSIVITAEPASITELIQNGEMHGETHGVKVDIAADGHLSNFTFGGRIAIRDGKADNLNLLLDKLDGEVDLRGSVSRAAGADHGGQQLLEIPQRYEFPVIIEGIPFVVSFRFALLLNEGLTNVGGTATAAAHLTLHGSQGAEWHIPGEPKAEPVATTEGEASLDFDLTRSEGVGLGPQALLVAIQYPWVGIGLGFGVAHAGPFVDVVTAASTTVAGAAAIIPCTRGEVYITGSAGLEAKFLLLRKSIRTTVYQKGIHKARPDIKACQG